jgi:uncharacterized protein (TIGR02145 family)
MKKIIICIALTVLLFACSKTESPTPGELEQGTDLALKAKPGGGGGIIVTTNFPMFSSAIQSTLRGNLAGGNNTFQRGFCMSTAPAPTISNDTVMAGFGNGDFGKTIYGLTPGTTYYFKAFALKNSTVYYGNERSFTTLTIGLPGPGVGIVTDIDGNDYNTVTYGTQVWMVENLKTTHYRDGTPIAEITDNAAWLADTYGAYCIYDNNPSNKAVYGLLYNCFAVRNTHNIAPVGWHVPTVEELVTLFNYVGGYGLAGKRMKETGFDHWQDPNTGADNTAEFYAVGAGRRNITGAFDGLQQKNYLWNGGNTYDVWVLSYNSESYTIDCCKSNVSPYGYSVRCVKDQ